MLSVDKIEDKIRFLFPFNDFDCKLHMCVFVCWQLVHGYIDAITGIILATSYAARVIDYFSQERIT